MIIAQKYGSTKYVIFSGITTGFIIAAGYLTLRTHLSKVISPDDIGKAQSLFVIVQKVAETCLVPTYNAIYRNTVSTFPKMFLLFGAIMFVPAIISLL